MPHIKFSLCLVWGDNNVSEELMPELAHRHRVKLPTCMHSTEYRVHSASPHRYRGQFSRFWGKCSWPPTEQTIHLLHFHLHVQGPSCHGFPCDMSANEFPSFSYLFFFFAGQMIILVQSTGPVSQLVSRVSELLH